MSISTFIYIIKYIRVANVYSFEQQSSISLDF